MKYYWKITRVRLESLQDETGTEGGDSDMKSMLINKANPSRFSMYDDDDNCYYEGMIYGDYLGFEPLWDFGTPNAGCTYIKLNGEMV